MLGRKNCGASVKTAVAPAAPPTRQIFLDRRPSLPPCTRHISDVPVAVCAPAADASGEVLFGRARCWHGWQQQIRLILWTRVERCDTPVELRRAVGLILMPERPHP